MTQRTILPALLLTVAAITATSAAMARDSIEVVGSSTVYPFQP